MNFNEGLRKVGSYLTAADVFRGHIEAENKIKVDKTGRTDILPFEAGLAAGTKIYLLRLKYWPIESATLMARWTGIDLAIKGSRRLLGK
jgi:hypothetical protein